MSRNLLQFSLACLLLFSSSVTAEDGTYEGAVPVEEKYAAGFDSITEDDSRAILSTLVEGEMSGRGTGQEGYLNAARWFADQLKECGFQPAGVDGTWFQPMPFIRMAVQAEHSGLSVGDQNISGESGIGISTWSGKVELRSAVSFAILQGERPESEDGFCKGKILVVRGRGVAPSDPWILKSGAAAVLLVVDGGRIRTEFVNQNEQTPNPIPAVQIDTDSANRLAAACGLAADLFSSDRGEGNLILSSSQEIGCRLQVDRESIDVPNVVGWYPGSDEAVRDEHICIGAHLDHLGVQRGELFPGADDNGSGSTAVLQVARAIHAGTIKPRRSVLLMAFAAEERGLLGSKYYAANPLQPLEKMVCMLNIDMIGRDEETADEPAEENRNTIHLVGSQLQSSAMHQTVLDMNRHVGFVFEYDEEQRVAFRSDQASFATKGIPVAFLFGGFNPHYHKTSDTLEGINFSKIANAARLYYLVLLQAADHGAFEKDVKQDEDK
ncbi:MAG: M20/M25/M40 family metallo-hydrolase [Planctomycetaceae bacterium]